MDELPGSKTNNDIKITKNEYNILLRTMEQQKTLDRKDSPYKWDKNRNSIHSRGKGIHRHLHVHAVIQFRLRLKQSAAFVRKLVQFSRFFERCVCIQSTPAETSYFNCTAGDDKENSKSNYPCSIFRQAL